jgi:hypothetical protein
MLSQAEIDSFVANGYVAVCDALPADVLQACQDEIWSELGDRGVRREDPSTWRDPVVRINCPESEAFAAAGTQPVLWEAFDQLIGEGRRLGRGRHPLPPVPGPRRVVAARGPAAEDHGPARRRPARRVPAGPPAEPSRARHDR